ncbi:hypothetical protein ACFL96_15915 [Thermoproteota archaeon]
MFNETQNKTIPPVYTEEVDSDLEETCLRNADYSPPRVYPEPEDDKPYFELRYKVAKDCISSIFSNKLACEKDFQNPNTTVSYPDKVSAGFELEAFVNDNMFDYQPFEMEHATTYSCLVPRGYTPCYPTGIADTGMFTENMINWNNTYINYTDHTDSQPGGFFHPKYDPEEGLTTGHYTLYFFSEDFSKNLEYPIKSISLFVDASPPDVEIRFDPITSWEVFEDVWRTNVTMTMRIVNATVTQDEVATCSAKFMDEWKNELFLLSSINGEYNDTWVKNYTYLVDGPYLFWFWCEDDVGNVNNDTVRLLIDGDKSVTDPQPRATLNYQDIEMSVRSDKSANCKYFESYYDDDRFNTTNFTKDMFDTLLPNTFALTGGTFHKQDLTDVANGYHRFYVKCYFPDENKIVGSRADHVRFAVDVEPPVTHVSTDLTPYQDWFNADVKITLRCSDPLIVDPVGLPWQYGCKTIHHCTGTDCKFFDNATAPSTTFTLSRSTNITFYSMDKGNNTEVMQKNVLFLIDKTAPNLTLEILEPGNIPAEFVRMDLPYKIKLTSDKPLISPAIGEPDVSFSAGTRFTDRKIQMFPTLDPHVWEGVLRLPNINENRGFEGDATLTATASDHHNVSETIELDFFLDTKPPTPPIMKPSIEELSPELSEYQSAGYPLKYNNGTYFTNDKRLFLTGHTDELLDIVVIQNADVPSEFRYTQFNTTQMFDDKVIDGVGRKIRIQGDLTEQITNEYFVGFGGAPTPSNAVKIGPRRKYQSYGEFYDVTSVDYVEGILGADQYTELTLYEPLEKPMQALAPAQQIFFYDRAVPQYWFGVNLDLVPYQHNNVLLFVYDRAGNIARYPPTPETFDIFYDPDAPMIISHYPFPGTTSVSMLPIEIRLKELKDGSGIDNSTINITRTGEDGVQIPLGADLILESEDVLFNNYVLKVYPELYEDGAYTVRVFLEDWAGNPLGNNETPFKWTFMVDSRAPPRPIFKIVDGKPGPNLENNTGQPMRWYTQKETPKFTLEFLEDDPVTIADISFENSPTEGERATCVREGGTWPPEGPITHILEEGTTTTIQAGLNSYDFDVLDISGDPGMVKVSVDEEMLTPMITGDLIFVDDLEIKIVSVSIVDENETGTDSVAIMVAPTVSSVTVSNLFTCTFNNPVVVMQGFAWADYGLLIDAYKTLDDGTTSDVAMYGPYHFTIDHEAPNFVMGFNHRIRDEFNLGINSTVTNEGHPLKGSFEVLGNEYPLSMINMMMSDYGVVMYSFIWPVPSLSKDQEGIHDLGIVLEDYAGNAADELDEVYIDLTAPRIKNLTMDISKILSIGNQYYTKYANITLSGHFHNEDIDVLSIWVEPGTYNETTGKYEKQTIGSVNYDAQGRSKSFSVSIILEGEEGAEILNDLTIFVMDLAGHVTSVNLNVWRDLKAPEIPRFCISPTGKCPPIFFPGQGRAINNNPRGTDKFTDRETP